MQIFMFIKCSCIFALKFNFYFVHFELLHIQETIK